MKTTHYLSVLLSILVFTFSGCEIIGGIFKAGMAVGIFVVIVIILLIFFIMSKFKK
ncbi:MAG TPA: hypothetical protein VIX80_06405 [Candidatus Kapabacteria bacterium]